LGDIKKVGMDTQTF